MARKLITKKPSSLPILVHVYSLRELFRFYSDFHSTPYGSRGPDDHRGFEDEDAFLFAHVAPELLNDTEILALAQELGLEDHIIAKARNIARRGLQRTFVFSSKESL